MVFADDTPEEGGGADSEGGGADSEHVVERKPSPQEGTKLASPTEADNVSRILLQLFLSKRNSNPIYDTVYILLSGNFGEHYGEEPGHR